MITVLIIMLVALFGALVFFAIVLDERARLERQWKTRDRVARERPIVLDERARLERQWKTKDRGARERHTDTE